MGAFVLMLVLLIGLCAGVACGARLAYRRFDRLERLSVCSSAGVRVRVRVRVTVTVRVRVGYP